MALLCLWIPKKKNSHWNGKGSKFHEKRVICRKPQFDENVNDEIKHSVEDSSIETRFEQFPQYETIFGFLFIFKKFKTLSEDDLKKYCINLEKNLWCVNIQILMV